MEVEKFDGATEREVLTSLIIDPSVLGAVSARWNGKGLFTSSWCNEVGDWCVEFFRKYGKAPKKRVVSLFRAWASNGKEQEQVRAMDRFLGSLDFTGTEESPYSVDRAEEYFNKVKLASHWEAVRSALARGDQDKADSLVTSYKRVDLKAQQGIDLFNDESAVRKVFAENAREVIVEYPDALAHFFKDHLRRGAFVALMAPTKVGKTFWLTDMAYRAVTNGKKVAFFSLGDDDEQDVLERFTVRTCCHPRRSTNRDGSWPCTVKIPTGILVSEGRKKEKVEAQCKDRVFDAPLSEDVAVKKLLRLGKDLGKVLRIQVHGNLSVSVRKLGSILDRWAQDGFVPDCVVVDYADNLAPVDSQEETRDRINTTWKLLRSLSIERNVLLLTATQTKTEGFKADWLTKGHFADDKRKCEQVTGMVGINQTPAEKREGIYRLNWVVLRGGDFHDQEGPYVASCLALARPAVKSLW